MDLTGSDGIIKGFVNLIQDAGNPFAVTANLFPVPIMNLMAMDIIGSTA